MSSVKPFAFGDGADVRAPAFAAFFLADGAAILAAVAFNFFTGFASSAASTLKNAMEA